MKKNDPSLTQTMKRKKCEKNRTKCHSLKMPEEIHKKKLNRMRYSPCKKFMQMILHKVYPLKCAFIIKWSIKKTVELPLINENHNYHQNTWTAAQFNFKNIPSALRAALLEKERTKRKIKGTKWRHIIKSCCSFFKLFEKDWLSRALNWRFGKSRAVERLCLSTDP